MEIQKELEEQFNIPPYKAAEMISQATKIVNNLLAKVHHLHNRTGKRSLF